MQSSHQLIQKINNTMCYLRRFRSASSTQRAQELELESRWSSPALVKERSRKLKKSTTNIYRIKLQIDKIILTCIHALVGGQLFKLEGWLLHLELESWATKLELEFR